MFIHTLARAIFGGSTFSVSIFWGVFRKMNILGGMNILWIFLGGHPKIGLVLVVISMYFRVFSLGKYTESGYSFGLQNFKYVLGVLDIPDIF